MIPSASYELTNFRSIGSRLPCLFILPDVQIKELRLREVTQHRSRTLVPTLWLWMYMQVAFKATCAAVALLRKKKSSTSSPALRASFQCICNIFMSLTRTIHHTSSDGQLKSRDAPRFSWPAAVWQCSQPSFRKPASNPGRVWKVVQLRTWPWDVEVTREAAVC